MQKKIIVVSILGIIASGAISVAPALASGGASFATNPVVGISMADHGCTDQFGPIYYSPATISIPGTGDTLPTSDIDNNEPDCLRINLNSQGPFASDFRLGVQEYRTVSTRCDTPGNGWQFTNWASQSGGALSWSPWTARDIAGEQHSTCYAFRVETRPLPGGVAAYSNIQLGVQVAEGDYSCLSGSPSAPGNQVFTSGGWSTWTSSGESEDCARVALRATPAAAYDAALQSDNIPTSFTTGQTLNVGSDGNPIRVVMLNKGATWISDQHIVSGPPAGTGCDVDSDGDGVLDSPSQTGTLGSSCSVPYNYYSTQVVLLHQPSSFVVAPESVYYSNPVTVTKTLSQDCVDITPDPPSGGGGGGGGGKKAVLMLEDPAAAIDPVTCTRFVDIAYSAPLNVANGQSATFYIDHMTAPAVANTYNETWQMNDGPFGTPFTVPIVVTPLVTGQVNVTSMNSSTGQLVNASWWFNVATTTTSVANTCTLTSNCTGKTASYNNQPISDSPPLAYQINPTAASDPAGQFVLHSVEPRYPIAQRESAWKAVLSWAENLVVKIARAFHFPVGNPQSQSLTSAVKTANFVILWDPVAGLDVSPASVSIDSSNVSGAVTVTNNGAPGSSLAWNAPTITYGSGSGWLSVSPSIGGVLTNGAVGYASTPVTITGDPTGLTPGLTYTATITFSGTSSNGPNPPNRVVNVSFNIISSGPPSVTITSPTPAASGVPVQVACSGGTGTYTWSATGPANLSSGVGTPINVWYDATGTYEIDCTSGGSLATTSIQITDPCTITASLPIIVPPQQSVITWSCAPGTALANSCDITNIGSGLPTSGSRNVAPTAATTYSLSCTANNAPGPAYQMTAQTLVTVQGPGRTETSSLGIP